MSHEGICFLSAAEMARAVREKSVSAVELVDAVLARVGFLAIEREPPVGFEEMAVGADLDGSIAEVGDFQPHGIPARIRLDRLVPKSVFAWNHRELPQVIGS